MYHGYYSIKSLDQVIALYSKSPHAIQAGMKIPALHSSLCGNENLAETDWDFLAKKTKKSDDLYALAYNSTTLAQAEFVLKDRRHTPKIGLIRGSNPNVDGDFLRKIYSKAKESATIEDALLDRADLPVDVLNEISQNPRTPYRVGYALMHNDTIEDSFITEYFDRQTGFLERRDLVQRMPNLIDKHPSLKEHFLIRTLNEDCSIKNSHRLEIISAIAETRHLTESEGSEILKYVKNTKSQAQVKVKIILGLLGNPNLGFTLAQKISEFGEGSKIQALATSAERDKLTQLIGLWSRFPFTQLKPGWEEELTSEEQEMLEVFGSKTENHPARLRRIPATLHLNESDSEENLPEEKVRILPVRPGNGLPWWTWRAEARPSIWYIDQEYENEDEKTWFNLLSLCTSWDGTISELLHVSKNL